MLAPYGIGTPDEDGWYPDYRPLPPHLIPDPAPAAASPSAPQLDLSVLGLLGAWRIVVAELALRGIDLYDPVVRARPWPGVRAAIYLLIDQPGPLREALTRR